MVDELESHIRANAELVRLVAREQLHTQVGYDADGVRWLEGYIDRQRASARPELRQSLPSTLGAYLGECIRQVHGGQWFEDTDSGEWGIWIANRTTVYPFAKVRAQLAGAAGESVLALFVTIGSLPVQAPSVAVSDADDAGETGGAADHVVEAAPEATAAEALSSAAGPAARSWWRFWARKP